MNEDKKTPVLDWYIKKFGYPEELKKNPSIKEEKKEEDGD